MKLLPAQKLHPEYYEDVRDDIQGLIFETIFKPLIVILKGATNQKVVLNAIRFGSVSEALKTGKIQYSKGMFSGDFNTKIGYELRMMGAHFDNLRGIYRIDDSMVTSDIKMDAEIALRGARKVHDELRTELDAIEERIDSAVQVAKISGGETVKKIAGDFHRASEAIIVVPELTESGWKNLSEDYNNNVKLSIKGWAKDEIQELRKDVESNGLAGYRFDSMIENIRDHYGVSQNKAEFLARQETSLLMSKFRKERLSEANVRMYLWMIRGTMTRADHKLLANRAYEYANPPVVNQATKKRGNPGEDFGCLCGDRPILGTAKVGEKMVA